MGGDGVQPNGVQPVQRCAQADHIGNLAYALTARNFNPLIAMAADVVFAEPQEIVPVGVIPPDSVMTPSVVVTHIIAKETVHG